MSAIFVLNFKLVRYAKAYYENQNGIKLGALPDGVTKDGVLLSTEDRVAPLGNEVQGNTLADEAIKRDLTDKWTYKVEFHFTTSKVITYENDYAREMLKAYRHFIFGSRPRKVKSGE